MRFWVLQHASCIAQQITVRLQGGLLHPTDDERILKRLDDDGKVVGFLIHEMSALN